MSFLVGLCTGALYLDTWRPILCAVLCVALLPAAHAADDADPLEALYQQQAQKIQQLEAQVSALQNTVSGMGQTMSTMAQKVAFTAHYSAYDVNVGDNAPFKFDAVVTNIGNGYNANTGIFTAPVAGLYYLDSHIMHDADRSHSMIHVVLDKDGQELCRAYASEVGNVGSYAQGSCRVATHLSVGQQVFARRLDGGTYVHGGPYNAFSGFLISADTN